MKSFIVGKEYYCTDSGFAPILILKRTDKTIWVDNGQSRWCMRIKHDASGNEYVVDSKCGLKVYRDTFTYCA